MEEQAGRAVPDAGMLGCDREVFAQVWDRVSPGADCPIELAPADAPGMAQRSETVQAPLCFDEDDQSSHRLQALVLTCLTDGSVYRDLTRRTRRSVTDLTELSRRKTHHAKRLSAAYFLMTGVRYWPQEATPVNPPERFFAALRERFLAEGRLAGQLKALGEETRDPCLKELYLSLAEETMEMVHTIRLIVERET